MATSLKTVCYPLPNLASVSDASVTNFAQISLTIPESGLTFRSVYIEIIAPDLITATGGTITEWRIGARLGASAYTTLRRLSDITHSGEQMAPLINGDFTSLFTASWAGQSSGGVATMDVRVYLDQSTGTTLGFIDVSGMVWITYEYDDTSSTQLYTCIIPLESPTGALATSKGSALDTIPNLDSFLGYGSISYKSMYIIAEGNEAVNGSTASHALNMQVDTATPAYASGTHTQALATDRYVRYNWDISGNFTTNATHSFYAWCTTTGRLNHFCFTIYLTFTFDATSSNDGNRTLLLPMEMDSPMGGTTSTDAQRNSREFWIEEPTTIVTQKSAFRLYFDNIDPIAGLNVKSHPSQSAFTTYTHATAQVAGSSCLQRTCDADLSLARGRNTLTADVYRTDTTDRGWNISGIWIINYKCGKPTGGWGKANRTVKWNIQAFPNASGSLEQTISAIAPTIPESNYFMSAIGCEIVCNTSSSSNLTSYTIRVERLGSSPDEGGPKWENVYRDITHTDPEVGPRFMYAQMRELFKRYPNDQDSTRMDIEQARRWKYFSGNGINTWMTLLNICMTYHTITFSVAGDVTGSGGGTVTLKLHRASNGELLDSTSRSGNGAYSFTWYDSVENVFVEAVEDGTHLGRSADGVAS